MVMGVSVYSADHYVLEPLFPLNPLWFRLVRVLFGVFFGLLVYWRVSILLGLKESLEFVDVLKRRLTRRRM